MNYLYIGKLVNTHGIKGEVRIISKFRHKNLVFTKGFKLYIVKEKKEYEIEKYRVHKNFDMVVFKDNYDINLIEYLKGSFVYINKDDLKLEKNEVLAIDLINFNVIIDGKSVGIIKEVLDMPSCEVLSLDTKVMIPYVKEFIKEIDLNNKVILVNNMKGLIS